MMRNTLGEEKKAAVQGWEDAFGINADYLVKRFRLYDGETPLERVMEVLLIEGVKVSPVGKQLRGQGIDPSTIVKEAVKDAVRRKMEQDMEDQEMEGSTSKMFSTLSGVLEDLIKTTIDHEVVYMLVSSKILDTGASMKVFPSLEEALETAEVLNNRKGALGLDAPITVSIVLKPIA